MEIIYLKDENLEEIIKDKTCIVDFYADWCGPCKMLANVLEDIKDKVQIIKVNVDDNRKLAIENGVMSIPQLNFYESGKLKTKKVGFMSAEEILEVINSK